MVVVGIDAGAGCVLRGGFDHPTMPEPIDVDLVAVAVAVPSSSIPRVGVLRWRLPSVVRLPTLR